MWFEETEIFKKSFTTEEEPIRDEVSDFSSDDSVASDDLFGVKDNIIQEGTLHKFKPGLSNNFQSRHL